MSRSTSRSSLTLAALLSLTTSLTSLAGVALAESIPAAPQARLAFVAPAAPAVVHHAPKPKPRKRVVVHAKPSPTPSPQVHHAAPKPVATHTATPKPTPKPTATHTATSTSSSLTLQQRMMRAVAEIPGYRSGDAVWVLRKQSNWGLALMGGGTVYISTSVPLDKLYDVVVHEWSHLLSVRDYANDVNTATAAMNAYFGGSGLTGAERAADCMAKLLGASWTHYTPCTDSRWRAGAKRLIAGEKL